MNDPTDLVSVRELSFNYGSRAVLDSISFVIERGDFLAVLGPNGSGKTTLLKLMLGLLRPRSGSVLIRGKTPQEFHDWNRVGYIPQKAARVDPLFPASAAETVAMAIRPTPQGARRRGAARREAVDRSLDLVGLREAGSRRIGDLSGGEQQRVFIARALVNQPFLLLLDEPTAGVDIETQGMFYDMLGDLNRREGITIVLVTHDIGVVDRNVSRVACLNQRLTYHGSHDEFCRSDAFRDMIAGGHHLVAHRH